MTHAERLAWILRRLRLHRKEFDDLQNELVRLLKAEPDGTLRDADLVSINAVERNMAHLKFAIDDWRKT